LGPWFVLLVLVTIVVKFFWWIVGVIALVGLFPRASGHAEEPQTPRHPSPGLRGDFGPR
jgi:hypothetical protein